MADQPRHAAKGQYISTFQAGSGEAVLADLMETFHVTSPTHCGENTHETAFCEGQRSVVLWILEQLRPEKPSAADKLRKIRESYLDTAPLDVELGLSGE